MQFYKCTKYYFLHNTLRRANMQKCTYLIDFSLAYSQHSNSPFILFLKKHSILYISLTLFFS